MAKTENKKDEREPFRAERHIRRMSDDEIREFVNGVVSGQIYTDRHIPESLQHAIHIIFMPLVFGIFDGARPEDVKQVGCLWEWLSEAGPRGVNGCPSFLSMKIMHRDDFTRAHAAIVTELKRRENIEIPPASEKVTP